MKKRIISALLVISTMCLMIAGCGKANTEDYDSMSKSELLSAIKELKADYNSTLLANADLKDTLDSIQAYDSSKPAIYAMQDESNNLTFNSYDAKMIFPSAFQYPESIETAGTSNIEIAPDISFQTTGNWVVKLNGATVELEHSSGINAMFKIGEIYNLIDNATLKDTVVKPWFEENTTQNVKYSDIFLNGTAWGTQAQANIFIDTEPAYLRCGMLGYGNYALTYVFVYRGEQDANKDESIKSLLNTLSVLGQTVTVD